MAESMTFEEIDAEIERLKNSPYVALARAERMVRYHRTRVLENLRREEAKGRELEESGLTMDVLEEKARGLEDMV